MNTKHPATMRATGIHMLDGAQARQEGRTRRIALGSLAAFAAVVLLVNGTMITIALKTWSGLAIDGAYERGLAYNQTLDDARAQAELGWKSEVRFVRTAPAKGILTFHLVDAAGDPIRGADVEAIMFRPTHEGSDFRIGLESAGGGTYQMDLTFPVGGVWDAFLVARTPNSSYHQRERLLVP